jgi:tetratricopeptide (TPR) repeat protein
MKGPNIALHGEVPDIVVPTVGISIDSIAETIRGFLHSSLRRRISGEFTISDRQLWLRLRIDGHEFFTNQTAGAPERPDDSAATAVPELLKRIQPYIVAAHMYKKDPPQALKIAQQTIARLPDRDENVVNCYVLEAWIYTDRKSYSEATQVARRAIRIDPRSAPDHNSLGNVLYREDKFDEAMAEYRLAVKFDPKAAYVHANIGNVLRAQHKHDEALQKYREAIALDPNLVIAYENLGSALYLRRRADEAITELRRGCRAEPRQRAAAWPLRQHSAQRGRSRGCDCPVPPSCRVGFGRGNLSRRLRHCFPNSPTATKLWVSSAAHSNSIRTWRAHSTAPHAPSWNRLHKARRQISAIGL